MELNSLNADTNTGHKLQYKRPTIHECTSFICLFLVAGLAETDIIPFHWYPSLFANLFSLLREQGRG